jgi:Na+/melibiose symporter-like transporter
MVGLTILGSAFYAPTIPLVWAIFADVADYSEWKIGRRFTGMVFATIGFALKSGLALGQASFLWLMAWLYSYDTGAPTAAEAVAGYRAMSGIAVGVLFAVCTGLLMAYKLNKQATIEMSDQLAERRKRFALQPGGC